MKKLYFLDEEERNRILNIHETATKRQYLDELWGIGQTYTPVGQTTGGELDKAIADPAKKAERIKNISRIVCSLKGDKITNKNSQFNGKSWVDYVTSQQITSAEEAQARKLCSTGGDERLYNIAKIACSVDASGKITNPNSKYKDKMFTDYIRIYKLTGVEVENAKKLCGKLGNKPAVTDKAPDKTGVKKGNTNSSPRVQEIQKQLGVQNSTGTLDVATLQAMLSKLNGNPQAQPVSSLTPVGVKSTTQQPQAGMTSDQLNAAIQQLTQNANRPI
jgi:hypothetical protein